MPPTRVLCPCDKSEHEITHWLAEQGCPLPPQARADYQSSLHRTLNDTRHKDGHVTITRLLTCPRAWLIQDLLPYTFNPLLVNKMKIGTLVQEEIARFAGHVGAQAEVKVRGELFGLDISASIDLLSGNMINEGKFHGELRMDALMGRAKWLKSGYGQPQLLNDEHVAQVNMQRKLLEQNGYAHFYPPNQYTQMTGKAVHLILSHSSMSDPLWPSERAPIRDEDWIGNVRPMGMDFNVRQIAGMVENFQLSGCKSMGYQITHPDPEERIKARILDCIPKVGATCSFGAKKAGSRGWLCDNCPVLRECDAIG